jgi:Response regulator containing a CheY-like receiver domain and an HTH DNA-binding domain
MRDPRAHPIRLLMVDDHEVLRLGLRTLFSEAGGFEVVGEAGTMGEAISKARELDPDVVLMDVRFLMAAAWKRAARFEPSAHRLVFCF